MNLSLYRIIFVQLKCYKNNLPNHGNEDLQKELKTYDKVAIGLKVD